MGKLCRRYKKHSRIFEKSLRRCVYSRISRWGGLYPPTGAYCSVSAKNGPTRYFVGNAQTGGYGITLTAANTVIYYSNSYDLEKRLQAEDRAHRIRHPGSRPDVDLIAENTIDERIVKSLRSKINIANEIMGEDIGEWI